LVGDYRGGAGFLPPDRWSAIFARLELSQRETQIVALILHDEPEVLIAAELGISSHTVHTHLERIYRKLRVSSRCQLVLRIFREYVKLEDVRRGASRELSAVGYSVDGSAADG
jgi:DNA-binding CsgD family transcriptional regulator